MTEVARFTGTQLLRVRLGVAGLVLLVEYLGISFGFDAQTVAKRGGVWSAIGEAGRIGPLVVVAATAFLLLPPLRRTDGEPASLPTPNAGLLAIHALLLGMFVMATNATFGRPSAPPGPALLWMLGWAAIGAATAATLFVGVLGEWQWLLRTLLRAIAAGGVLGLAAWLAGSLSTELWAPLSHATFVTVAALLRWFSFDLETDAAGRVLRLDQFAVDVAPVCSGLEGIGLFSVLIAGFLYRFRDSLRFPRSLALLPLGMGLVWIGNAVRIAFLMLLGAYVDPDVALGSFHSKAGWVFFCLITLGVALVARKTSFFARRDEEEAAKFDNPAVPLLLPFLCWIGIGLVTSMLNDGHDPFYPLRVVIVGVVIWSQRRAYLGWLQRPSGTAWALGFAVGVVWLLPFPGLANAEHAAALPGADASRLGYVGWIIMRCLGAVVVIPILEELAFRAYLARWLTRREFWDVPFTGLSVVAIVGSSVLFGLLHDRWLLAAATGIVYALLLRRTGKIIDAIAAHAASNAVIAAWVLATGNFQHW